MPTPIDILQLAQALQQKGPAPFSAAEDARYGFPGQGDAYDNPDNPNYWLNNLQQQDAPVRYAPMGAGGGYPIGEGPGEDDFTDMGIVQRYGLSGDEAEHILDSPEQAMMRQRGPIGEPDAAYQPGRSSFMSGPGAAQDSIRKISEAIMLGQERPIWGQDYLGPATGGEMDAVSYQATPYEQGRSMPPAMAGQLEGGDQELQDLTGLDPYGNPLPPAWAQRVPNR